MTDRSKASQLILRKISEVALGLIGGESKDNFIATSVQNMVVSPDEIAVMTDPDPNKLRTPQSAHSFIRLSRKLNAIQHSNSVFTSTAEFDKSLVGQYVDVAEGDDIEWAVAEGGEENEAEFREAMRTLYIDTDPASPVQQKTDPYLEFCTVESSINRYRLEVAERRIALSERDDGEREQIEEEIENYEEVVRLSEERLAELDREHGISDARSVVEGAGLKRWPPGFDKDRLPNKLSLLTDSFTEDAQVPVVFDDPGFLAEENWTRIRMTADEIRAFAASETASAGEDQPDATSLVDDDIDSIDLELQVLTVYRPWFWPGLFSNRLWRWKSDDAAPISTGGDNPEGRIPAYVTGLVFARNLSVKGKKQLRENPAAANAQLKIGNFMLQRLGARANRVVTLKSSSIAAVAAANVARVTAQTPAGNRLAATVRPAARSLSGVIQDPNGGPVAGAKIQVTGVSNNTRLTLVSNAQGRFVTHVPRSGKYKLTVTKKGYNSASRSVDVARTANLTIKLNGIITSSIKLAPGIVNQLVARGALRAVTPRRVVAARKKVAKKKTNTRVRVRRKANRKKAARRRARATAGPTVAVHAPVVMAARVAAATPTSNRATLTITVDADRPLDSASPATITLKNMSTGVSNPVTMGEETSMSMQLPRGAYTVTLSAADYEVEAASRQVNLNSNQSVTFKLKSRYILRNEDVHVVAFTCRRVPKSPNPSPNAIWH